MRLQIFKDRTEAGKELAKKLTVFPAGKSAVLALHGGSMPVAFQIAHSLNVPLDTVPVRRLRLKNDPEQSFGIIAPGGVAYVREETAARLLLSPDRIHEAIMQERPELDREMLYFRSGEYIKNYAYDTLIIVADGFATGISASAAIRSIRQEYKPKKIICAAPVCSREACDFLAKIADEVVTVLTPDYFLTVGQWYERFNAVSDDEALYLLNTHNAALEVGNRQL